MKILIVDDEPQVAEILAKSLGREGHQATIATSGEHALSLVGTYDPDALFLDVSMPGMNGLDVLAEVRRRRVPSSTAGNRDFQRVIRHRLRRHRR